MKHHSRCLGGSWIAVEMRVVVAIQNVSTCMMKSHGSRHSFFCSQLL